MRINIDVSKATKADLIDTVKRQHAEYTESVIKIKKEAADTTAKLKSTIISQENELTSLKVRREHCKSAIETLLVVNYPDEVEYDNIGNQLPPTELTNDHKALKYILKTLKGEL